MRRGCTQERDNRGEEIMLYFDAYAFFFDEFLLIFIVALLTTVLEVRARVRFRETMSGTIFSMAKFAVANTKSRFLGAGFEATSIRSLVLLYKNHAILLYIVVAQHVFILQ